MPNYCENDLWVRGDKADVDALLLHVGMYKPKPEFDFNTVIPYPEKYRQMDDERALFGWEAQPRPDDPERAFKAAELKKLEQAYVAKWGTRHDGYNSGGYEWCHATWGTKWNAGDVARRDYDGRICISFQTAWGPPIPVIIELAKRFPLVTLTIEFFERGMEVIGGFQCPSKDDYYDNEKGIEWEPGIVTDEWEFKGYRGVRGG